MQSRNSFGYYYPIDSLIHRLNPVMKLVNFILMVILICLPSSIYVHAFALALVVIMIFMSYVPFRFYIRTIWALRYIYILIAFFYSLGLSLSISLFFVHKILIKKNKETNKPLTTNQNSINHIISRNEKIKVAFKKFLWILLISVVDFISTIINNYFFYSSKDI